MDAVIPSFYSWMRTWVDTAGAYLSSVKKVNFHGAQGTDEALILNLKTGKSTDVQIKSPMWFLRLINSFSSEKENSNKEEPRFQTVSLSSSHQQHCDCTACKHSKGATLPPYFFPALSHFWLSLRCHWILKLKEEISQWLGRSVKEGRGKRRQTSQTKQAKESIASVSKEQESQWLRTWSWCDLLACLRTFSST